MEQNEIEKLTTEELKELIRFKKDRLHFLKGGRGFRLGEGKNSQKEAQRRRNEIQKLTEELLKRHGD